MRNPTTWNPKGVSKGKQIALRLLPAEEAEAVKLAKERHQSRSAMAREAYLLGLPLLKEQPLPKDGNHD
jgi:hypothetical protein